MRFIYSLAIHIYNAAIHIAALFNSKAQQWVKGRCGVFDFLSEKCADRQHVIWFHCASLGEFEQGKPLMQKYREAHPEATVLVTFFSPSGYEIKKNDPVADIICYLPIDTPRNAKRFIQITKPEKVVFVKYEFWFNYMQCLKNRNIPFYFISTIFRPSQYFFKPIGKWFARQLNDCSCFFVQNEQSESLLQGVGISQVEIAGDTRFDRVYDIAKQNQTLDFVEKFASGGQKLIVAGSTWQPDEQLLKQLLEGISQEYKLVLAPHVTDAKHIAQIQELFSSFKVVRYTQMTDEQLANAQVLIIDTIGILSKIYKYSYVSYVGGAFETGLHNTLEAAVFGVPLFFGPNYSKFNEAVQLVNLKGAFSIYSFEEMKNKLQLYEQNPDHYKEVCDICEQFVQKNSGSCTKIMQKIG